MSFKFLAITLLFPFALLQLLELLEALKMAILL